MLQNANMQRGNSMKCKCDAKDAKLKEIVVVRNANTMRKCRHKLKKKFDCKMQTFKEET
jgi:hypothetical protein